MENKNKKILFIAFTLLFILSKGMGVCAEVHENKIGYADLRQAFYGYYKTPILEKEITELGEATQRKRETMVSNIAILTNEIDVLTGQEKEEKQEEFHRMRLELQQFDQETRETILNMRNDMFTEVIDDIQAVVNDIGSKGGYQYILDSRNIMYADNKYDLTQEVINRLNENQ